MSLDQVTPGKHVPDAFNVIIEIPMNADPVKYEGDKETGAIFVDRFMSTAMHYPTNYGYVPKTISGDGDPVDVLVITPVPLIPGVVVTWLHRTGGMGDDAYAAFLEHSKTTHPMGRVGQPEEVAELIYFLASPKAGWITGISCPIDGGRSQTCAR